MRIIPSSCTLCNTLCSLWYIFNTKPKGAQRKYSTKDTRGKSNYKFKQALKSPVNQKLK